MRDRLRRPRRGHVALLAVLLGLGAGVPAMAGADTATTRIAGGTALPSTAAAPFSVVLEIDDPTGTALCSGTILDARHVLTAAHCVTTEGGEQSAPGDVTVGAGIPDVATADTAATRQVVGVAAVRRHPNYRSSGRTADVAMLTLAKPLNLSGPDVRALALPAVNQQVGLNAPLTITGYGDSAAGDDSSGRLRQVAARTLPSGLCGSGAPATVLCTIETRKGVCSGDSGGTARTGGANPVLLGVTDIGSTACARSSGYGLYANVAAPEIRTFIDNAVADRDVASSAIPRSPRGGTSVRLRGTVRVGRGVTCRRGRWSKGATFRYAIFRVAGDELRASAFQASSRVRVPRSFKRKRVGCLVEATNAGGIAVSGTSSTRRAR